MTGCRSRNSTGRHTVTPSVWRPTNDIERSRNSITRKSTEAGHSDVNNWTSALCSGHQSSLTIVSPNRDESLRPSRFVISAHPPQLALHQALIFRRVEAVDLLVCPVLPLRLALFLLRPDAAGLDLRPL